MEIKIGTRGSLLALWQADYIKDKLEAAGINTEIKIIDTKGDKILDRSLAKIGSKGVFTEELEEQLLTGEIDIAVHSAKDLQSDLGENLEIIAFTEREKICDVLISNNLSHNINDNLIVGTSSTRRVALLKAYFPNLKIVEMRGNLQTRIKKMENGDCDALMLAFAGVNRMKYNSMLIHEFDTNKIIPPVGQGTVAVEIAKTLSIDKKTIIRKICNDFETEQCLIAERSFLKSMQGGCSIPIFGNARLFENNIIFNAGIISLDGKKSINECLKANASHAEMLGIEMAALIKSKGGIEILDEIKRTLKA